MTIVGHDAGAVSVGLHMLSPFSKSIGFMAFGNLLSIIMLSYTSRFL